MAIVFSEDFTGTNGDPWDAAVWAQTAGSGSNTVTIQSNKGRMAISDGNWGRSLINMVDVADFDMTVDTTPSATGGAEQINFRMGSSFSTGDPIDGYAAYIFVGSSGASSYIAIDKMQAGEVTRPLASTSGAGTATTVTSFTVTDPGVIGTNDVVVVAVSTRRDRTVTTPSGWNVLGPYQVGANNNTGNNLYLFWQRGEPSTWVFNLSTSSTGFAWICDVYRGVRTTGDPWYSEQTNTGTDTTIEVSALSSLPAGCMALGIAGYSDPGGSQPTTFGSDPSGWTSVQSINNNQQYGVLLAYDALGSSSSVAQATWTLDQSVSNWTSRMLALVPETVVVTNVANSTYTGLGTVATKMRLWAEGTALRFKVWAAGGAEPSAWNIDATDATHTTGKIGLSSFGTANHDWDNLSITAPAAFPVYHNADTTSGSISSTATSMSVTYPANIDPGDLLLFFGASASNITTTLTGFSSVATGSNTAELHIFKKVASGSESGTVTWDFGGASDVGAWAMYRISGATGDVEAATFSAATGTTVNPPTVTPSWGLLNNGFVGVGVYVDGNITMSAGSGNLNNDLNVRTSSTGPGVGLVVGNAESAAASYDPSSFTISASTARTATTLAIKPGAPNLSGPSASATEATASGSASDATPSLSLNAGEATASGSASAATPRVTSNAGTATATGSAFNALASVAPAASLASATGSASDATASSAVFSNANASAATATGIGYTAAPQISSNAGAATATAAAFDAKVVITSSAGSASATGVANGGAENIAPQAATATATGAANASTPRVAPVAGQAAATGVANNATVSYATLALAQIATATGTAYDAAARVVTNAALATATATAQAAIAQLRANASTATATGVAHTPAPRVVANASTATATGVAYSAASGVRAPASSAAATGTANSSTDKVSPAAITATATGVANDASVVAGNDDIAPADPANATGTAYTGTTNVVSRGHTHATATGAAQDPDAALRLNAALATAAGVAYNASVTTLVATNAQAQLATATGTAYNASVRITTNASHAAATGAANSSIPRVAPQAALATATGVTFNASVRLTSNASHAAASGAANGPADSIRANAGLASATGAANPSTPRVRPGAALATAAGLAYGPAPRVVVNGSLATALAVAYDPSNMIVVHPSFATALGVAYDAEAQQGARTSATATLATATGLAYNAVARVVVNATTASAIGFAWNSTGGARIARATTATAAGLGINPKAALGPRPATALASSQAFGPASVRIRSGSIVALATGVAFEVRFALTVMDDLASFGHGDRVIISTYRDSGDPKLAQSAPMQAQVSIKVGSGEDQVSIDHIT